MTTQSKVLKGEIKTKDFLLVPLSTIKKVYIFCYDLYCRK